MDPLTRMRSWRMPGRRDFDLEEDFALECECMVNRLRNPDLGIDILEIDIAAWRLLPAWWLSPMAATIIRLIGAHQHITQLTLYCTQRNNYDQDFVLALVSAVSRNRFLQCLDLVLAVDDSNIMEIAEILEASKPQCLRLKLTQKEPIGLEGMNTIKEAFRSLNTLETLSLVELTDSMFRAVTTGLKGVTTPSLRNLYSSYVPNSTGMDSGDNRLSNIGVFLASRGASVLESLHLHLHMINAGTMSELEYGMTCNNSLRNFHFSPYRMTPRAISVLRAFMNRNSSHLNMVFFEHNPNILLDTRMQAFYSSRSLRTLRFEEEALDHDGAAVIRDILIHNPYLESLECDSGNFPVDQILVQRLAEGLSGNSNLTHLELLPYYVANGTDLSIKPILDALVSPGNTSNSVESLSMCTLKLRNFGIDMTDALYNPLCRLKKLELSFCTAEEIQVVLAAVKGRTSIQFLSLQGILDSTSSMWIEIASSLADLELIGINIEDGLDDWDAEDMDFVDCRRIQDSLIAGLASNRQLEWASFDFDQPRDMHEEAMGSIDAYCTRNMVQKACHALEHRTGPVALVPRMYERIHERCKYNEAIQKPDGFGASILYSIVRSSPGTEIRESIAKHFVGNSGSMESSTLHVEDPMKAPVPRKRKRRRTMR